MIGTITVGNYKLGARGIYIGRAMPRYNLVNSPLANPYKLERNTNREIVLEQYKQWLWQQIKDQTQVYSALKDLAKQVQQGNDLTLVCWCAPLACHGEIVKSAIKWIIEKGK